MFNNESGSLLGTFLVELELLCTFVFLPQITCHCNWDRLKFEEYIIIGILLTKLELSVHIYNVEISHES
jgi:hypothetical protein